MTTMIRRPRAVLRGSPETPEDYLRLLEASAREAHRKGLLRRPEVRRSDAPLTAYVSDGRWVADCPDCGAGISVDPEWPLAGCFECFRLFSALVVPPRWREIEAALEARPKPATRNWLPRESVADLLVENAAHGVRGEAG
jgi:hypothetical protein